jgi:Tol biopolymer transport system component
MAAAAAAGAAGSGAAVWALREKAPPASAIAARFRLPFPEGVWMDRMITRQTLAVSPIGGRLAFIGRGGQATMIWAQRLDSVTATPLQGTEDARSVFWSPDGRYIGFYSGGKLKKIAADGGTPLPICDLFEPWVATWNQHGVILAAASRRKSALIQADSGAVTDWKSVFWPTFLPDGKHLLYLNVDPKLAGYRAYVEEISSGRTTELAPSDTRMFFCPDQAGSNLGYLLYCKSGTLLAQRFDAGRLSTSGAPVSVAEGIPYFQPAAWSEFSASQDGVIVFSSGIPTAQPTWLDRTGREIGRIGQPQPFWGDFRISRDGSKISVGVFDLPNGGVDIWIHDLAKGTAERVTFERGVEAVSVWSPDGTHIAYGNAQSTAPQLRLKALSERGEGIVFPPAPFQLPFDWSSDGRWIFYQTTGGDTDAEIWIASAPDRKIMPLVQGTFDHSQPCLSPDRRHLAFIANETGRREVYIQRFEGGDPPRLIGERKRVSLNGGYFPRWCKGGKELIFLSFDREVMSSEFSLAGEPEFTQPKALFKMPLTFRPMALSVSGFDVNPDGSKFLILAGKLVSDPLHVILNWQAGLKR